MTSLKKQQTYEEALQRLEEIVSLLENDRINLDESINLFSEGAKLIDFCNKSLENAKLKIEKLMPNGVES